MTTGSTPQTPNHKHNEVIVQPLKQAQPTELDAAIAGMRAAETLLHKRHATIKTQPNIGKKIKPIAVTMKKDGQKESSATARLHPQPSPPAYRPQRSQTADEACAALQRRQLIKNLAFNAASGCPCAIADIEQVNAHFALKARHPETTMPDLILDITGVRIRTSQLSTIEHRWISRFNAITNNATLVKRRLMKSEDHEAIVTQLFPAERHHILKPEHFEIFVAGFGEEGILTRSQAKSIARLGVTVEEFDNGARFTIPAKHTRGHSHNPATLVIFDIPKQASRGIASFSPHPSTTQTRDLHHYLRILVEAAVYGQKFWKGYFFASARSKLNGFYQAYKISQEGWLLPANLTDYKRQWTHRETRLLERGQLICNLLKKYEAGELTDFGIVRVVRATYVQIPAQPFFNIEDLESFLYHRITDSGLSVSKIPEILTLHPENDALFANPRLRDYITDGLKERASQYEEEEKQRLSEIETSHTTFETVKKAQMTLWERVKGCFKQVFGKKVVVVPFDPFAADHEDKDDEW